jgi:hypothetical protein
MGESSKGYEYTLLDGGVRIERCTIRARSLAIPEFIDGMPVTAIAPYALEGNADSLSGLSDHGGIIDQHRCADSVVKNSAGSKKCLIRLALRKCYSFGILFGFFDQSFNQAHVHLSVFYISGQLSLFSMTANAITKGRS